MTSADLVPVASIGPVLLPLEGVLPVKTDREFIPKFDPPAWHCQTNSRAVRLHGYQDRRLDPMRNRDLLEIEPKIAGIGPVKRDAQSGFRV